MYTELIIYSSLCWLLAILFYGANVKDDEEVDIWLVLITIFAPIALPMCFIYVTFMAAIES
jgi:hypothetical protein